jgi:hypothetical protein
MRIPPSPQSASAAKKFHLEPGSLGSTGRMNLDLVHVDSLATMAINIFWPSPVACWPLVECHSGHHSRSVAVAVSSAAITAPGPGKKLPKLPASASRSAVTALPLAPHKGGGGGGGGFKGLN